MLPAGRGQAARDVDSTVGQRQVGKASYVWPRSAHGRHGGARAALRGGGRASVCVRIDVGVGLSVSRIFGVGAGERAHLGERLVGGRNRQRARRGSGAAAEVN
jgi:hypothetical protein